MRRGFNIVTTWLTVFENTESWEFQLSNSDFHFVWSNPLLRRRLWHPTPVLLPGKSHGWRSLVGCSPWGREESDTTEWLPFHFSLSCIGEGNGNPLQCSCLENPRDGGAWWAAIYGVIQSRTWLKWLSNPLLGKTITISNVLTCNLFLLLFPIFWEVGHRGSWYVRECFAYVLL